MTVKTILLDENANDKLNEILKNKLNDPESVSSSGVIIGMVKIFLVLFFFLLNSNRNFKYLI